MNGINWKRCLLWTLAVIIIAIVSILTIRIDSTEVATVYDGICVGDGMEVEEDVVDEEDPLPVPSESDASLIAQILYTEIGAGTKLEQSAVVWTILNRVDSDIPYFPDTIEEVCTQKIKDTYMFAYDPEAPVREDLYDMAVDVMVRWYREKAGERDVGRTLPIEYVYFWGDGKHNHFRVEYQGKNYWDWSLASPYEEEP